MCAPYHFKEAFVNTVTTKPERDEDRRNPDQGSGITRIRATDKDSLFGTDVNLIRKESEVNHD